MICLSYPKWTVLMWGSAIIKCHPQLQNCGTNNVSLLFYLLHLFPNSGMVMALSWHTPNTHFHHLFYHHFYQSVLLKLIHLCELLERPFDQRVNVTLLFDREHIQLQRRTFRFKPVLKEIFTGKCQNKKTKSIPFRILPWWRLRHSLMMWGA